MDDVLNAVKSSALNVAEFFTPVLKTSRFKETGVITPEEFVEAGDHLVHHCPTWQWASGDESKLKPYLPKDKQLIITRNVPCYRRFKHIDNMLNHEKELDGDDSGWVDTHFYAPENTLEKIKEMTLENKGNNLESCKNEPMQKGAESDDDGDAVDMETFMDHGVVDDDPNVSVGKSESSGATATSHDDILQTRTYDLNITYDKYYQTPRMWLNGYDEDRKPLSVDQMYEDFSEDHKRKTITIETHPNFPGPPMASIHPCRHAEVMKRIIEQFAENDKELGVHQYLIIFLKFLQAIIPTIEYDFTRNVTM